MNELIVFPDVIAATRAALLARLPELGDDDVPVVETVPTARPPKFVRILRTGGTQQQNVIDKAMVTLEAWDQSDALAGAFAQRVRAVVNAMAGTVISGVTVYTVTEFSGPANSPDPVSHQPRHTWTVEIGCRGHAAA